MRENGVEEEKLRVLIEEMIDTKTDKKDIITKIIMGKSSIVRFHSKNPLNDL